MGYFTWQIPIWKQQQMIDVLDAELKVLRAKSSRATHLKNVLDDKLRPLERALDEKRYGYASADVLLELTNRIPDNSWVEHLELTTNSVVIQGESQDAAALVNHLEKSPMFEDVKFHLPVVTIPGTLYERFHLSAKLSKRGRE
jgi:general secretion pathway protein L